MYIKSLHHDYCNCDWKKHNPMDDFVLLQERVHYLLSAADSDATAALVYLAEALEVCVASGLHEMEATVHYQLACCHIQGANPVAALKQADLSIECVPQFSDVRK